MTTRPARVLAGLATIVAAALASGCGAASNRALDVSLRALQTPAAATPAAVSLPKCVNPSLRVDPTRSLRPGGPVPAPADVPPGSFMAAIQRRGHLIAGVNQNALLLGYANPLHGDRIEGFEIDLLHQLSTALFGRPDRITLRALTIPERITAVRDGTVDIVADEFTITCERAQQVDFSSVYLDAEQRVLVPSSSPARSLNDMSGKHVCASKGSTSIETLKKYPKVIPYAVPVTSDCLVALQRDKVDGITSDDAILQGFKAQDPFTKLIGPPLEPEPYGMAIGRRHPEFVRYVNALLARMRADGTWRQLYRRWLPGQPTQPPIRYRTG
jgi:polar amino acid transport system substrate-binding protein